MAFGVKKALAGLAALALIAGATASAQVPDPYARELAQKLARAEILLGERGYARGAGPFAGGLGPRQSQRFTLMLRAGQDYRIVGVCDDRCDDLDLRLRDPNGEVVGQDVLEDSVPVIHARPQITGQYAVEVAMLRCRVETCWYAVNVYAR